MFCSSGTTSICGSSKGTDRGDLDAVFFNEDLLPFRLNSLMCGKNSLPGTIVAFYAVILPLVTFLSVLFMRLTGSLAALEA